MTGKTPLWKKILKTLVVLAIVLFALVAGLAWYSGAWNALFPSSDHDTVAPVLPVELTSPAVLVFSKTNGFRHEEGIAAGSRALDEIADDNGWDLFATENGAVFNEKDLARFDAVVFLSASGDILNLEQEQVFQRWMEAGGGWLGIHAAGDGSHAGWQWYMDNLIGAKFTAHIMGPQFQRATVVMDAPTHPAAQGLPNVWTHVEEWYSWEKSPRDKGFTILAVVEEDSYSPVQKFLGQERDLSMGDHPVVWANCVGRGRSVYSALGHRAEAFEIAEHLTLLEDALRWTLGLTDGGCQ